MAYLSELGGSDLSWGEPELEASLDVRNVRLTRLMLTMADELVQPGFASDLLVEAIALEIAVELLRYRLTLHDEAHCDLPTWRLRRIDERIEAGPTPVLRELADLCGLSIRQLSRSFRISRGVSLGRYINDYRLDQAKQRLLRGESVKAVAYAMGFSSPATFCKAFRRGARLSPGEFKRRALLAMPPQVIL
jgi:AraC family transcriptional regulator